MYPITNSIFLQCKRLLFLYTYIIVELSIERDFVQKNQLYITTGFFHLFW